MGSEDFSLTIRRIFLTVRRTWPDFWGLFGMVWGAADIPTVWAGYTRDPAHMWQGVSMHHTLIWSVEVASTEGILLALWWIIRGVVFCFWNWSLLARLLVLNSSQLWDWPIEDEESMNLNRWPKRLLRAVIIFLKGHWSDFEGLVVLFNALVWSEEQMDFDAMGELKVL